MQTLPDYDLDALFRSALASEAEELAPTAANESQMLERIARGLVGGDRGGSSQPCSSRPSS